jgi:hypothetical protein
MWYKWSGGQFGMELRRDNIVAICKGRHPTRFTAMSEQSGTCRNMRKYILVPILRIKGSWHVREQAMVSPFLMHGHRMGLQFTLFSIMIDAGTPKGTHELMSEADTKEWFINGK